MIASMMSFCRTLRAVQAPLTTPMMRQCAHCSVHFQLQPVFVGGGSPRLRRAVAASAADGVAMRSSWGTEDRTSELRGLNTLGEWLAICARGNWQQFSAHERYAAIRKLVQLLRDSRGRIPFEDKEAVKDTCEGMFESLLPSVSNFDAKDQQILVLELSQLGIVFINPEWHSCCPEVPVRLLNALLDDLLQRLRKLRGDQVGVLLISLQRLQLQDRDAYTKILDEIERQLKASGPNAWYHQADNIGKLVRGVATVFLGIPNGMDREQACRVLNLMAEEARMLADEAQGRETPEFWVSMASIMESYTELHAALPGLHCDHMFDKIGELYLSKDQPIDIDGKGLVQIARVYGAQPFSRLECSGKVIKKLCERMQQKDLGSLGGFYVAEIADALSQGSAKDAAPRIEPLVQWMLNTSDNVSNEAGLRMLAAAGRVGLVTSKAQWKSFAERFGSNLQQPPQKFFSQYDRELLLMLDASISCSVAESSVSNLVRVTTGWMKTESLRLWRIVPYLMVMARGVGKYKESSKALFSDAMTAMEEELSNGRMLAQRSQLLQQAVTAFLVFGDPQLIARLVAIADFNDYLEEQGGSAAAILGQAIVDSARIEGPDLIAGQLNVEAVQIVWTKMLESGARLAASYPEGAMSTPFDALPPRILCELFVVLYNGLFDSDFVTSLKPNAAMLATVPESLAEEFSRCEEEPAGCSHAWMRACLHFLPDHYHEVMRTFRHTVGARAGGAGVPAPVEEPSLEDQLKKLTVAALKEKLVERELKVSGRKGELIERLLEHMQEQENEADTGAAAEQSVDDKSSVAPPEPVAAAVADSPQQTAAEAPQEAAAPAASSEAAYVPGDSEAFSKLTVKDLKALLKENSLKIGGKKQELVERCIANGLSVPVSV